MFNSIVALGYGIIVFAILIGVGSVVLYNFGGATASCATGYSWNSTQDKCVNATNGDPTTPGSASYTNTNYLLTQIGSSGLAGWTPAVIAISIGMLFLGFFLTGKGGKKGRY